MLIFEIFYRKRSSKLQRETPQSNKVNDGKCVAILSENYYLFSNEDCSLRFSPLCIKKADIKVDVKTDVKADVKADVGSTDVEDTFAVYTEEIEKIETTDED